MLAHLQPQVSRSSVGNFGLEASSAAKSGSTLLAMLPPQKPKIATIPDPVPDPEPASPSLPEPDPGVYHHDPARDVPVNKPGQ
jgi:hypothetical protein